MTATFNGFDVGEIDAAIDLLSLPLLHEDNDLEWRNWFILQGVSDPSSLPGPRLWHAHLTLNAARQGRGVALANSMLLGHDPKANGLVRVIPKSRRFEPVRFGGYTFMTRDDQWNVPAIKRFRYWLQKMANPGLVPISQREVVYPSLYSA